MKPSKRVNYQKGKNKMTETTTVGLEIGVQYDPKQQPDPKSENKELPEPQMTAGTEFRVIKDRYTVAEAAAKRSPGFRDKKCILGYDLSSYSGTDAKMDVVISPGWRRGRGIETAYVFTVGHVIEHRRDFDSSHLRIWLLDEEKLKLEPPKRRIDLDRCMSQTLITLMKHAPTNPVLRSHLLAMFGQVPPPELITYQQVRDWLEHNFDEPVLRGAQHQYLPDRQPPPPPGEQTVATGADFATPNYLFEMRASHIQTEIGRCDYNVERSFSMNVPITETHMQGILAARTLTFNQIVDALRILITNKITTDKPGDRDGEYHYNNHEAEDEDMTTNIDIADLATKVRDYLRRRYGPLGAQEIMDR